MLLEVSWPQILFWKTYTHAFTSFYEKKKYSPQIATSFELIEEDPLMAKQPSYLQDRLSALK